MATSSDMIYPMSENKDKDFDPQWLKLDGLQVLNRDNDGVSINIDCIKCNHFLTIIKITRHCIMNIEMECKYCGFVNKGTDMTVELAGKIYPK